MVKDFVIRQDSEEYKNLIKGIMDRWEESSNHKKLKEMWDEELLISRKRRLRKENPSLYKLRELGV